MQAPLPKNEQQRLAALHALNVLDTLPEEAFDRITRLAAHIVGAPMVVVSLVDEQRQWFKSRIGLEAEQTHRDVAFCAHAILNDELLVVPDASRDTRFANNPLVTGAPNIRFYAGAPLIVDTGIRLGTLCAIDTVPRDLQPLEHEALRDLAAVVVSELKLRRSLQQETQSKQRLQRQQAQLERVNQSLDQFAHMASHDLRAPLKTMINMADIALRTINDESAKPVRFIRNAATELESLVTSFRRLAKLQPVMRSKQRVSVLIDRAVRAVEAKIATQLLGDAELDCDPDLMTQVFVNLVSNAGQHGSGGCLRIEASSAGDWIVIRASNPVSGPLSVDESVFAPFRRLSTATDGTGLGLAIVDRVTRLHGGDTSASCEDNQFCVELRLPSHEVAA